MKLLPRSDNRPEVSAELGVSNRLTKMIRKLRWIGMEEEARALALVVHGIVPTNSVLTGRLDTD
jgi:hypothetical protein